VLLAVVLQVVGATLLIAAAALWLGLSAGLAMAGLASFAAGLERELRGG
jgi:hypothetical protein